MNCRHPESGARDADGGGSEGWSQRPALCPRRGAPSRAQDRCQHRAEQRRSAACHLQHGALPDELDHGVAIDVNARVEREEVVTDLRSVLRDINDRDWARSMWERARRPPKGGLWRRLEARACDDVSPEESSRHRRRAVAQISADAPFQLQCGLCSSYCRVEPGWPRRDRIAQPPSLSASLRGLRDMLRSCPTTTIVRSSPRPG